MADELTRDQQKLQALIERNRTWLEEAKRKAAEETTDYHRRKVAEATTDYHQAIYAALMMNVPTDTLMETTGLTLEALRRIRFQVATDAQREATRKGSRS